MATWVEVADAKCNVRHGHEVFNQSPYMNPTLWTKSGLTVMCWTHASDVMEIKVLNPFDVREAWSFRQHKGDV